MELTRREWGTTCDVIGSDDRKGERIFERSIVITTRLLAEMLLSIDEAE